MIKEPSISLSRVKSALGVLVAMKKISWETCKEVERSLMLDWEEEKWKKRQTREGFCELFAELLEQYDATIDINSGLKAEYELMFKGYGYADLSDCRIDAELARSFPKMAKRRVMFRKVFDSFSEETQSKCHIDKLRPIFRGMRLVRGISRITDSQYKAMLDELEQYMKTLEKDE
ncbi:MAG: hypothetical protein NC311_14920 [Muribaculaceae bacterium]|nr:hypothetical protein [Muribaculaceae bacterium]